MVFRGILAYLYRDIVLVNKRSHRLWFQLNMQINIGTHLVGIQEWKQAGFLKKVWPISCLHSQHEGGAVKTCLKGNTSTRRHSQTRSEESTQGLQLSLLQKRLDPHWNSPDRDNPGRRGTHFLALHFVLSFFFFSLLSKGYMCQMAEPVLPVFSNSNHVRMQCCKFRLMHMLVDWKLLL